jgi:hypothetical protein
MTDRASLLPEELSPKFRHATSQSNNACTGSLPPSGQFGQLCMRPPRPIGGRFPLSRLGLEITRLR